ncbi:hypothetical protein [Pseudobacteriovorax antillogorgiicola]|uniref:Uncharacterized protein n=1 Tax=Pseudobacteriovorax antillogorgiicola TaxID=1513793 RepID=A0A1Y6BVS2_9BACT|nr:hypothetical protein [Pseudobacteriovorax antillogorgiicola]TCS53753.1 hypothetical protein EDD56_10762 [Pseudobacteriovorax antillogorgiicola]SMF22575.1 hypothetical protein SAMN06296036_107210 [Pseudobacteriovorax antillogorgiicola]
MGFRILRFILPAIFISSCSLTGSESLEDSLFGENSQFDHCFAPKTNKRQKRQVMIVFLIDQMGKAHFMGIRNETMDSPLARCIRVHLNQIDFKKHSKAQIYRTIIAPRSTSPKAIDLGIQTIHPFKVQKAVSRLSTR